MNRVICNGFNLSFIKHGRISSIHTEKQDDRCEAFQKLLDLIDAAARDGVEEFPPLHMPSDVPENLPPGLYQHHVSGTGFPEVK